MKSAAVSILIGMMSLPTGLAAAERSAPTPKGAVLEFSTGGAYHFEGLGAWNVNVANDGKLSIAHDIRGKVRDYGPFQLKDDEVGAVWALIARANIAQLASSARPGVPDEVQWTLSLKEDGRVQTAKIWEGDARKRPELWRLAAHLGVLVARLTKQKPVGFPPPEAEPKGSGPPPRSEAPWGQAVDGLTCRLVVPAETCVGEAVPVSVEIRNVSKETRYVVSIFDIQFPKHAKLDIAGPDGKALKLSSWGETTPMPKSLQPLGPGEVKRVEFPDLGARFATYDPKSRAMQSSFGAPGPYRLTYTFAGVKLPKQVVIGERIVNGQREKVYETIPDGKLERTWAGTLVSNTATLAVRELRDDEFAVHEWGVFTVFNDLKYANANRKAEWASLPDFFYRQFPSVRLKWEPAAWDKPLIHFYCTRPTLKVDLKVTFADGAPVAWWPCCANPVDQGGGRMPKGGETPVFRSLQWSAWLGERVYIPAGPFGDQRAPQPAKEFDLPAGSWLLEARLKGASLVSVAGSKVQRGRPWASTQTETERFIYYDGLVPAPNGLRCVAAAKDSVTVRNAGEFPIRDLFVVDRRTARSRTMAFAHVVESIALGAERQVSLTALSAPDAVTTAREAVKKALVAAGLFEAEAAAILKIWDQGFLGAPGVTAFYLLPQAEYDRMLPLETKPAPKKLVRVGIALHPQFAIEPELTQQAERLIAQLGDGDPGKRDAAAKELAQLGPVAWRLVRQAIQKAPASDAAKRMGEILKATDAADWLRQAAKDYKF